MVITNLQCFTCSDEWDWEETDHTECSASTSVGSTVRYGRVHVCTAYVLYL